MKYQFFKIIFSIIPLAISSVFSYAQTVNFDTLNKPVEQLFKEIFVFDTTDIGDLFYLDSVVYNGINQGLGSFEFSSAPQVGFKTGLIMSTGKIPDAFNGDHSYLASSSNGIPADSLAPLSLYWDGDTLYDISVINIYITTRFIDEIRLRYAFFTEENTVLFPDKPLDKFAILVGKNVDSSDEEYGYENFGLLDNGFPLNIPNFLGNADYYDINEGNAFTFDYITKTFNASIPVEPCGVSYHIQIAIGDARDSLYDSGVLLKADGFFALQNRGDTTLETLAKSDTLVFCHETDPPVALWAEPKYGFGFYKYEWQFADSILTDSMITTSPEETTTYYLTVRDGCSNADPDEFPDVDTTTFIAKDALTIRVECPVEIPNVFTPNEDGVNDIFDIKNIDQYPNSTLIVYNRWGDVVFENNNYENDWEPLTLAEGVYFYVLYLSNGSKFHGSVSIFR